MKFLSLGWCKENLLIPKTVSPFLSFRFGLAPFFNKYNMEIICADRDIDLVKGRWEPIKKKYTLDILIEKFRELRNEDSFINGWIDGHIGGVPPC